MPAPPPQRVAVVEDHLMLRELLVPLLRDEFGFTVVGAVGTVAAGVELCRSARPDFVVADWMLPDGRGFDIVRAIAVELPRLRWLFVSSNESGHVVREAVSLQIHGFVMKRGSLETMRTAVREVAAGRNFYCPMSSGLLVDRLVTDGLAPGLVLTPREREVLQAFAEGENPKAIASRFGTSVRTVQNQLSLIREKLGLQEPAALVLYALRHGLVEPS